MNEHRVKPPVPSSKGTPLLFTPIQLRGVQSKNRILVSPMCQYSSVDGGATDWHLVHMGRFALGGAGIVCVEESAVEARGRKTYHCAGIWDDDHIPKYQRITEFIRAQGGVPAIQLGHSGRKASCHGATRDWAPLTQADAADGLSPWQGIAPSPILDSPRAYTPKEMDASDIRTVLDAWREAARRALDAGFEFLEIHGAHGYLIHQFLSPLSNRRTDGYGGDRAGRMRFALEVAESVRRAWPPDKPLSFRVSAVDGKGGVWNADDTIALAKELKPRGVDFVDCSSGGISGNTSMPVIRRVPGYHVEYADRVRREAGMMTIAVGLITDPQHAEDILVSGKADLVALARELLWNPNWPVHAAKALGVDRPYDVMPEEHAYRLRRRDEVAQMDINRGGVNATSEEVRVIETT